MWALLRCDQRNGRNFQRARPQKVADDGLFLPRTSSRIIVAIVQPIGQELMARATHPLQIDLRFRDAASKLIDVIVGRLASDFSGDRFDLFG